jgi:hypothetical protein
VLVGEQRRVGRIGSDVAEELAKEHGHDHRAHERCPAVFARDRMAYPLRQSVAHAWLLKERKGNRS